MSNATSPVLDRLLDPIGKCLTREAAEALIRLRADPAAQIRMEELARKCNEGKLSPEERSEYEACVWASNFIAILQSKARALLSKSA